MVFRKSDIWTILSILVKILKIIFQKKFRPQVSIRPKVQIDIWVEKPKNFNFFKISQKPHIAVKIHFKTFGVGLKAVNIAISD